MRSRLSRHLETILHPAEARRAPGLFLLKRESAVKPLESEEPVLPAEFSWRDYALMLLHVAAEIEHSLMVQYLFAAYSLGGPQVPAEGGKREQVRHWQEVILGIAKEEMGHFISVQNVLRLLGGPLNLDREDYPWGSDFYPFDFTLEPLTRDSLAKYIYAEMPDGWDTEEARAIKKRAEQAAPGQQLQRVGVLYDRLQKVLKGYLKDSDFQPDTVSFQASWDEWGRGYVRGARGDGSSHAIKDTPDVIVRAVGTRDTAVAALHAIAEQGEARRRDSDLAEEKSHFYRFLQIYRAFPEPSPKGDWTPTRRVAVNPTTTHYLNQNQVVPKAAAPNLLALGLTSAALATEEKPPREVNDITHPQTLGWAHLLNVRYRMLLMNLAHAYRFSGALSHGDELTARGLLINRTFGEMYNIRSLSGFLVQLPLTLPEDDRRAGPPFEMPYTVELPDADADRWRLHLDLIEASRLQIVELQEGATPQQLAYLAALRQLDEGALAQIQRIISGC